MSRAKQYTFFNMDEIDVDDEFDALSVGMDEEEEEEEEGEGNWEETIAGIKQLENEIDEEEKQKTEGIRPTADAWKEDYSKQPENISSPQPQPISIPISKPQQTQTPSSQQSLPAQVPQQPLPAKIPQQPPQKPNKQQQTPIQSPQAQKQQTKTQTPKKEAPQQTKTQAPQKQTQQKKPQPKPPQDFVNEKANSEEYNELFKTFADTFYSMLHSKSHQQTSLEQIEKILPMITNGPSEPIKTDTLDLSRPKLKAPAYREYEEFKKKSISTALNPKEIDKVISEIDEQIKTLKKDAKLLLSLKCKNFAAYIINQMKALKLSTIKMREEPYYISDVFHYYVPEVNKDIPPNVMRIKILSGSGFPKGDLIAAILLPLKDQGYIRVNTPSIKGPNPTFNYQVDVPLNGLRSPNTFKRFQTEPSTVGVYVNVGKEIPRDAEPTCIATIKTNFLFCHHSVSCPSITFEDIPGALLNVECFTYHALARPEMKPVEMRIKCSPFVSFAKKTKKAAAAEASQRGTINSAAKQTQDAKKQEITNSTTHKVTQPAKAEMRSQEEIKKKQQTPIVYVFTDEELKMFWPGGLVMFVLNACKKVAAISQQKGEPLQEGLQQMIQTLETNWKKIEDAIGNEDISEVQYMKMIEDAIAREQTRLPSIPENDRETHEGFIALMNNELEQCKENLEDE